MTDPAPHPRLRAALRVSLALFGLALLGAPLVALVLRSRAAPLWPAMPAPLRPDPWPYALDAQARPALQQALSLVPPPSGSGLDTLSSSEDTAALDRAVEPYGAALARFEAALAHRALAVPSRPDGSLETRLLPSLLQLTDAYLLRARCRALRSQAELAARDLTALLSWLTEAQGLSDNLAWSAGIAILQSRAGRAVGVLLPAARGLSAPAAESLARALEQALAPRSWVRRGYLRQCRDGEAHLRELGRESTAHLAATVASRGALRVGLVLLPRGWVFDVERTVAAYRMDCADTLRALGDPDLAPTLPEAGPWTRATQGAEALVDNALGRALLSLSVSNFSGYARREARLRVPLRFARVGLAVARARLATGALPSTLEALVPAWLSAPPGTLAGRSVRLEEGALTLGPLEQEPELRWAL